MRKVVFDIETSNDWDGPFKPTDLDIAMVCIHDSKTGEFTSYTQDDLGKLWPIIEKTDLLIGYNSDHFDIPLLNKYYPGDLSRIKSIDLLKEIRKAIGKRLKLDSVAEATLGRNKTADGLQAVTWWKEGKIDKVREYCIEDVRITKELYDHAKKHGKLNYSDFGTKREIPLNTSDWEVLESSTMTHTLPF